MKTFLSAFLFLAINGAAQNPKQVLKWINTARAENKNFYFEIPFEYRNDHIIIKVRIGNTLYDYIFDSGGYNDITDAIQLKNNFPVLTIQEVGSANQVKAKVNIVKVDSLQIGELLFKDLAALQMNFDHVPGIKCAADGGLIGASIIKNYIWQIDFSKKTIIVTDQLAKLSFPSNTTKVPVTFNSRLMPYIETTINGKKEKLMFDLGSSTLFSLTQKTALRYLENKEVIEIAGGAIEGGNGVTSQAIKIFKADSVTLPGIVFRNKPVVYTALSNVDLLGNPVIKNFIVTLNFKDSELYFSPLPGQSLSAGWESFGFKMEHRNNAVVVSSLYKGLSADKAGLQIGDVVVSIDGEALNCIDYCDCVTVIESKLGKKSSIVVTVKSKDATSDIRVSKDKVF